MRTEISVEKNVWNDVINLLSPINQAELTISDKLIAIMKHRHSSVLTLKAPKFIIISCLFRKGCYRIFSDTTDLIRLYSAYTAYLVVFFNLSSSFTRFQFNDALHG